MKPIALILILCLTVLSGCVKKSDNTYNGVEEKETTEKYIVNQVPEETTDNVLDSDSIDKELVDSFIDDSHFYDSEEGVDFAGFDEEHENYHIKILDAYIYDDL